MKVLNVTGLISRFLLAFVMAAALLTAYGCGKRGEAQKAEEQADPATVESTEDTAAPEDGSMDSAGGQE